MQQIILVQHFLSPSYDQLILPGNHNENLVAIMQNSHLLRIYNF